MSSNDDDFIDLMIEDSREKIIYDYFEAIGNDPVINYLGKYGESIEQRIQDCRKEAENLMNSGFYGPSLAASVTGTEIAIRFFLFRPIVQGAFLSEEWADTLADRIITRRTADDREMLPNILRHWGVELKTIALSNGDSFWSIFTGRVRSRRNDYMHKGTSISLADAKLAEECLSVLLENVVSKVRERLHFSKGATGNWEIRNPIGRSRTFKQESPF